MTWPTKRQKVKINSSSKVPTSAEGSLTMKYYSAEHKKFDQYDQHDLTKQKTKAKTNINTSSTVLTLAEESLTMTCYYSAEPKTCQLWHTWSEWRGHTSWPTKRIKMTKKKATTKVKTKISSMVLCLPQRRTEERPKIICCSADHCPYQLLRYGKLVINFSLLIWDYSLTDID